jgi:hypothetical protein
MLMRVNILFHDNARPNSARTSHEMVQQFQWKFFYNPLHSTCVPVTTVCLRKQKRQSPALRYGWRCTRSNLIMVSTRTIGLLEMWYKET